MRHRLILAALAALALLAAGCGERNTGPDVDLSTFDGVVAYGGTYEEAAPAESETVLSTGQETADDGTVMSCTTKHVSIVDAPSDYATFDPNADVVYPGSMLQGGSLGGASPDPIVVERAPGTISINLLNGSGLTFRDIPEVKYSAVIQAMNDILADNSGVVPAAFSYNFSEVQSERQMALNMGVNFQSLTTNVKARLSFSQDQSYNRMLVELNQRFFTMSFDMPTSTAGLFQDTVTPADLARYVQPGNPATYVGSVTYGRRFYLLVESTSSVRDMRASVDASYKAALAGGSAHLDGQYVSSLENVNIKVFALGGDASQALATFQGDLDQVATFLTQGGDITTGVPLSYVVRNVYDNSIVNVKVATDYDLKTCTVLAQGLYSQDFDNPGNTEGWTAYGDFRRPLRVLDTASNIDGPYLAGNDLGNGGTGYFRAPLAWGGDWSHFHGGTFSYYLLVGGNGSFFAADDIVMYGKDGQRIAARFIGPGVPTNGIFKFSVDIDETNFKL
ncbi:thiol-activated cytolysin family protein, partial [bacterium]|nr:thiol-activated cytolysin family protein [bacterium]